VNIQLLKNIFGLLNAKEKRKLRLLFVAFILTGIFEIAGIASIAPFMAVVSSPEIIQDNHYLNTIYMYFEFANTNDFLVVLGVAVILLLVFSNAITAFTVWQLTSFANNLSHSLSVNLLKSYLSNSYEFFLNNNSSTLEKNVLSEVFRGVNGVLLPLLLLAVKAIIVFFILLLLIVVNPFITFTAIFILGGIYLFMYRFIRSYLIQIGKFFIKADSNRYKFVGESLSGIKNIKLNGSELEFVERYSKPSKLHAKFATQNSLITQMPRYLVETISFSGIVSLIIYFIYQGEGAEEVIPLISIFALAAYRIAPAIQQIYQSLSQIKYTLPAINLLFSDIKPEHEYLSDGPANKGFLEFKKSMVLNNIGFKYLNSDRNSLSNINIEIVTNTTIGIVGETGSGKTTLVDLILGLIVPSSGNILIDGNILDKKNLKQWQHNIGYVPQDIFLLDDSITRNIAFSASEESIPIEAIKFVCKIAGISEFIELLPDGYETVVGERGAKLSGGQIQRIGIARALYKNPSVIVFDEATSALDNITEKVVMEAVNNLAHKKTIIMISHRISSIRNCDIINVMDNGSIVDSGTYDELMVSSILFQKLVNS
jgi:ATP-binding cassette, subfamily B, bacterial PglK